MIAEAIDQHMDGYRSRATILVVDDDPHIQTALRELLEDAGYTAVVAGNGAEALAALRVSPRPGLILLDLMMPVMDGWTFCAAYRADPALARVPVVVVSAAGRPSRVSVPDGVAGMLAKPYDVDALLDTVERVLAASGALASTG